MRKQAVLLWAISLSASALPLGCGLSDDDDGDSSQPGTSGAGPNPQAGRAGGGISLGGTGGTTGGGSSVFDGGSVPLTRDEANAIRTDSCAGWAVEGEALTSVIQLVVDVSSSMNQVAPGTGQRTRWEVAREALLDAIVGTDGPGLPATVAVGLLFYPNQQATIGTAPQDITQCVNVDERVEIDLLGPPGADHRNRIGNAIRGAQLQQSTPTHDAFGHAYENGLRPTRLPGQKFMLLITDGAPTLAQGCMNESGRLQEVDAQPIVDEVARAAGEGARTFLIGVPGSEPNRTWMSMGAVIGGTAPTGCNINGPDYCHMDMTTAPDFSTALRAGLARVAGAISPCAYAFAEPPAGQVIDPTRINVVLSSPTENTLIVRDDVGDCTEGWQLTPNQEIMLCPDTCAKVQGQAEMVVDVVFGCGSLTEPPR